MNEIDIAAARLIDLKLAEAKATAERIDAETALLLLVDCPAEGSKTHRGQQYKVTVTGNVNRRVDEAALGAVRERLGPAMFEKAFRFKPEVSVSGIKYLRDNEPDLYAIAAQAFTATPGKASVRAEMLDVMKEAA
jgi:hypothetical protein